MSKRRRAIAVLVATVATTGTLGLSAGSAAAAGKCKVASNVEFINDDSGSMSTTDPARNRAEAIKLLLAKAANRGGRTYGAVEFGSAANVLFPPTGVTPSSLGGLSQIVDQRTLADDGSTDYNLAFAAGFGSNPTANARVFLTDGAHNEGVYSQNHRGGPPTYVVGFGTSTLGADGARLAQIASETAGKYYPQTDSSSLTSVVNGIDARLNCARTKTYSDTFKRTGQSKRHSLKIGSKTHSMEFTLLWGSALQQFDVSGVRVYTTRKGHKPKLVGISRRHTSKLKVRRVKGRTFVTVRVRGKGLRKGKRRKIRFRIKAKKLNGRAKLITTVSQSRKH